MSLGNGCSPPPYAPPLDLTKMTDEQKIDHQIYQMNKPRVIYERSSSYKSSDSYDLAGALLLGSMLF
jgi:hypothetical protein